MNMELATCNLSKMVCCEILSPTCKKVYSIHEGHIDKSSEKHGPSIHEKESKAYKKFSCVEKIKS